MYPPTRMSTLSTCSNCRALLFQEKESETKASNATSLGILTLIRTQSLPEPQVSPRDQLKLARENLEAEL